MRILAFALLLAVAGCNRTPPLPLDLPLPVADLMEDSQPLPDLPEHKPIQLATLYENSANVRGVCVADRRRLRDLQTYVRGLTK